MPSKNPPPAPTAISLEPDLSALAAAAAAAPVDISDYLAREIQRVDLEMLETRSFLDHFRDRQSMADEEVSEARALRDDVLNHLGLVQPADVAQAFERESQALLRQQLLKLTAESLNRRQAELEKSRAALAELLDRLQAEPKWEGPVATSTGKLFEVIEEERLRIARDLHDGPAQSMSNLVLQAELMERMLSRPEQMAAELDSFRQAVRSALEDTRRFIFDLRPMTLDDLGLVPTLERYVAEFQEKFGIEARITVRGEDRRLPGNLESVLFRICQEALNNVQKHSGASRVDVALNVEPGKVSLRVKDDGSGFEVEPTAEAAAGARHLGLISMQERTAQLSGRLEIKSQPGQGTEVLAEFALEQHA